MAAPNRDALRTQLRGTVARGYCHDKNRHKELDGDLLEAIVDELLAAPDTAPPAQAKHELRAMADLMEHGYGANEAADLIASIKGSNHVQAP